MNFTLKFKQKLILSSALILGGVYSFQVLADEMKLRVDTKYTRQCKTLGISKEQFKALPKRRIKANSPLFVKRLTRAQELMGDEKYDESLELLKPMAAKYSEKPYSMSQVYQIWSYVLSAQGKYKKSVELLKKAIELKQLPYRAEQNMLLRAAQLYNAVEDYKSMQKYILIWLKHAVNPNSGAYETLASAYVQNNELKKGICPLYLALKTWYPEEKRKEAAYQAKVQKALDDKKPPPPPRDIKHPKKAWFTLLFSMHYRLKDSHGAVNIMKAGLHHYPRVKSFWTQLGAVYAQLEDFQNATAVMSLAYRFGLLDKGSELRYAASNYTYVSVPYKAAAIMNEGLNKGIIANEVKNWRATAGNWQRSEENKKAALAYSKAGEIDTTGKYFINEGDIYARMESWRNAVKAYRRALKKGSLKDKDKGRAYLNMGIAQFNSNDITGSINTLRKAIKFKKQKRTGTQWLTFVQNKKNRKR